MNGVVDLEELNLKLAGEAKMSRTSEFFLFLFLFRFLFNAQQRSSKKNRGWAEVYGIYK